MFFRKKKKEQPNDAANYGFSFADRPLTKCSDRALSCALKGLIIFAAVYGTLGGLISSFHLPCYMGLLFVILLIFSVGMAFLHYNRLVFNVFYPLTFLLFVFSIFTYRFYVYSGFQAFLNILQEKYSAYFNLSILREAQEYFTDRNVTITISAVFIGFFLIVLLNIAVSEYMSLPAAILLTFPIFQLGIYVEEMPDFPYLILLLFSYFMIAILKKSAHFLLPYRNKEFTEFSLKKKAGKRTWRYHASGKIMLQLTGLFFAFSLLLGILCLPFLSASRTPQSPSAIRKTADEYVKILTQNGLFGFFNRYEASGGLSEGQLGGISSVRPDYETDLTVTYVPFAYETLYLKAYTGQDYTGSSWSEPDYNTELYSREIGTDYEEYEHYTSFLEARRLAHYIKENPSTGIFGKIKIENIGANENHLYLPYYVNGEISVPYTTDRGLVRAGIPVGSSYTAWYYPLLTNYWKINEQPDEMLADLAPDSREAKYIAYYNIINTASYIDMPDKTREELEEIKEEIGTAANIDAQINAVRSYLHENYTYSMTPGTTPRNADFAVYFLKEQKSGYCAHFATAAALLLRSYGIPARYVEGYALSFQSVAQGTAIDEPVSEWFRGENPMGETGVVSVNVTDASAHAWVEVYKTGIGWVPYEFTPPDSGSASSESAYSDFWGLFSGIFGQNTPETVDNTTEQRDTASIFKNGLHTSFLAGPLLMFIALLLCACILFFAIRHLSLLVRMHSAYRNEDYAPLLAYRYRRLCEKLRRKGYLTEEFLLPSKLPEFPFIKEGADVQMELLEKCCYSRHKLSRTEADTLLHFLKQSIKAVK